MKYWFKPARFWKWFAAYYPTSWQGWFSILVLLAIAIYEFYKIDMNSHSLSDTLLGFVPWLIILGILFDLMCRKFGQYPYWWRK